MWCSRWLWDRKNSYYRYHSFGTCRCVNDLTLLLLECSLHVGNGLGEWSVMTMLAIFSWLSQVNPRTWTCTNCRTLPEGYLKYYNIHQKIYYGSKVKWNFSQNVGKLLSVLQIWLCFCENWISRIRNDLSRSIIF
jgi:hypothetical protein